MVARNREDYIELAKALSRKSSRKSKSASSPLQKHLGNLREALEIGRATSHLFDIDSYVRSYEALLGAAWDDFVYSSAEVRSDMKGPGSMQKPRSWARSQGGLHHVIIADNHF